MNDDSHNYISKKIDKLESVISNLQSVLKIPTNDNELNITELEQKKSSQPSAPLYPPNPPYRENHILQESIPSNYNQSNDESFMTAASDIHLIHFDRISNSLMTNSNNNTSTADEIHQTEFDSKSTKNNTSPSSQKTLLSFNIDMLS